MFQNVDFTSLSARLSAIIFKANTCFCHCLLLGVVRTTGTSGRPGRSDVQSVRSLSVLSAVLSERLLAAMLPQIHAPLPNQGGYIQNPNTHTSNLPGYVIATMARDGR